MCTHTWLSVVTTRWAALPKKVLTPVAYTTACISPCLMELPEYMISPVYLLTGNDSPDREKVRVSKREWEKCMSEKAKLEEYRERGRERGRVRTQQHRNTKHNTPGERESVYLSKRIDRPSCHRPPAASHPQGQRCPT